MQVKGNHPLAEIIAKKLFGIGSVPKEEQDKMVNRACKGAVKWAEEQQERLMLSEEEMEIMCEKVHKAYCQYQLDHGKEEYWTKGDYSKLEDKAREIDRYTVRAIVKHQRDKVDK